MQTLIYEDICGGGDSDQLPTSLLAEGLAMLRANLADFSRSGNNVVTILDERVPSDWSLRYKQLRVETISSPNESDRCFKRLVSEVDQVLVIAPEIDHRLMALCQLVDASQAKSLNSTCEAVQLCSDKLLLANFLGEQGINVIPTFDSPDQVTTSEDLVRKPRYGCGSLDIQRVPRNGLAELDQQTQSESFVWQPFVIGEHFSVGCFVHPDHGQLTIFPPARQFLSDDGRFQYLGGQIDVAEPMAPAIKLLAQSVVEAIPGLRGFFGIDFIMTPEAVPVLVEINPRMTTSYVGYRQATDLNLATLSSNPNLGDEIIWQRSVQFTPDGTVTSVQQSPITSIGEMG